MFKLFILKSKRRESCVCWFATSAQNFFFLTNKEFSLLLFLWLLFDNFFSLYTDTWDEDKINTASSYVFVYKIYRKYVQIFYAEKEMLCVNQSNCVAMFSWIKYLHKNKEFIVNVPFVERIFFGKCCNFVYHSHLHVFRRF